MTKTLLPRPALAAALLLGVLAYPGRTGAQELAIPPAVYPPLPASAASAEGFAPPGWQMEASVAEDLDKDGHSDLVFVLRENNPANVVANPEGLGVDPLDTNPRILGVAFAEQSGASYHLVAENHTLIPRHEVPTLDDPFDPEIGLTANRGAFTVRLGFFSSAGGWEMGNSQLTFRYQNGRFELIGFDSDTTHRGSGEVTKISVNYSTNTMEVRTGSIENDKEEVERMPLKPGKLRSLDEVGNGLEFNPTE